jgi:hypothetical protein
MSMGTSLSYATLQFRPSAFLRLPGLTAFSNLPMTRKRRWQPRSKPVNPQTATQAAIVLWSYHLQQIHIISIRLCRVDFAFNTPSKG